MLDEEGVSVEGSGDSVRFSNGGTFRLIFKVGCD